MSDARTKHNIIIIALRVNGRKGMGRAGRFFGGSISTTGSAIEIIVIVSLSIKSDISEYVFFN